MAKALHLFREGERKKLIDRGSNSTTRSYNITGINPRNPYSSGWRENLELYASFNGLRTKQDDGRRYYGVQPKDINVCPDFSEADISMLDEAVPNFASDENAVTILEHVKAKCYAVADEIVNSWVEKPVDARAPRPRAMSDVDRLALKHMDIIQIITAEPISEESLLLDVNRDRKKRNAMLHLTKTMEQIQVRPKDNNNNNNDNNSYNWHTALKLKRPRGMWLVCDGDNRIDVATDELDQNWEVNLLYAMFPKDNRLKDNQSRSNRRRRYEKNLVLQRMAKVLAEEEREVDLKDEFDRFIDQSKEKQTFLDFKVKLSSKIEQPSNHIVTGKFLLPFLALFCFVCLMYLSISLSLSLYLISL